MHGAMGIVKHITRVWVAADGELRDAGLQSEDMRLISKGRRIHIVAIVT
jgi:hypothetical protein